MERVEVRARVSGFIDSIHFKEGQIVKQGDLLFVIDPRPYRLAVEQAKAEVERAKARLEIASPDVQRATPLVRSQTLTEREFETRKSTEREAGGQVASAEASLKQAELNLEWTDVRAPIAGRISDRRVDAGNLITGGSTGATLLTVIVSIDPIHFVFDGSEADFLRYVRLSAAGERPSSRDVQNPVAVRLADETDFRHNGRMNFVDNVLNPKTGTIRGRAVFDNKDGLLTPGFFGRLRLFGGEHEALLVPDSAIASDQSRRIVFTVAQDGTVGTKLVELGPMVDGLRVIRSGLAATDRIVIDGLQRARPGQKVKPEEGKIESPASAAAARQADDRGIGEAAGMRFSHFFVDRPIFASVISIIVTLVGFISYRALPITEYPRDRPAHRRRERELRGRFRRGHRADGRGADRAGDQRRRQHALRGVAVDRQRRALDQRRVQARHQYRPGAGAGAKPRLGRAAAPARGGAARRRDGAQEFSRPDAGDPSDLAGREPRSAIHLELCDHQHQGRHHPHRRRRRHHRVRRPRLFDAGVARPGARSSRAGSRRADVVTALRANNVQVAAGAINQPPATSPGASSSPCRRSAGCRAPSSSATSWSRPTTTAA